MDIRTRRRDDRLVDCSGLDRLPVDQVPGVLKSAPHKLSAHLGLIRFHYCQPVEKKIIMIASARKFSNGHQRRKSMSALSIVVGSWLVLNAVVIVVLTLRRDQPPVGWEK